MRVASGLKRAPATAPSCPVKTRASAPSPASQSRTDLSEEAETIRAPSGLNAALFTPSLWPLSVKRRLPFVASRRRTRRSSEAVRMRVPSALKAALLTGPPWPSSLRNSAPLAASQTRAVRSAEAVPTPAPSRTDARAKHRGRMAPQLTPQRRKMRRACELGLDPADLGRAQAGVRNEGLNTPSGEAGRAPRYAWPARTAGRRWPAAWRWPSRWPRG